MKRKAAKPNPHKSLGRMTAKRSAAVSKVLHLAAATYRKARNLEAQGKRKEATALFSKADQLLKRATRSGQHTEGPVGILPNPRKRNSIPDEWDDIEEEAMMLGSRAAKALGHSEREHRAAAKYFHVTWYSPKRGKRTGFVMPIEAHNATDAKRQARAMVTNEPKAANFVAKLARRNPGLADLAGDIWTAGVLSDSLKGKTGRVPGVKGKAKHRRPRPNPSLREVAETFQGKASGTISEFKAADSAPSDLARIGRLVFIKLAGRGKQLSVPGAMVAVTKAGKLWIVGSRAPMFNRKAKPGEALDFGEIDKICYETAKAHIEPGRRVEYVHSFGEEGGRKPRLLIDHEGMPILRGGSYQIKSEGIVN